MNVLKVFAWLCLDVFMNDCVFEGNVARVIFDRHEFNQSSDPSESHLCFVSPSPGSTAVANLILAVTQTTFTCTHKNQVTERNQVKAGKSRELVYMHRNNALDCRTCVDTELVSNLTPRAYF